MKFYAYAETNSTYDLILDHNTTAKVAWGSSTAEMNHAQAALDADTTNWIETARIISANEIARITGHDTFDSATTSYGAKFYFETNTRTAPSTYTKAYAWLYDYTSGCASTGCNISDSSTNGYWTSSVAYGADGYIWTVIKLGDLDVVGPQYGSYYGIRPVITISKNIL